VFFNKKEEKRSVGRPKLADIDTKKKAIIMIVVCLVMVIALLLTGAFKLNIINLNKLKGRVYFCNEIPARLQPRSQSNPEGQNEYGFTDLGLYSNIIMHNFNDSSYCSTITEEQLSSIQDLGISYGGYSVVNNFNGIQYLTGLKSLDIENDFTNGIDLSQNKALTSLSLKGNFNEIDLSQNKALTSLNLNGSNISSIDLSQNTALTSLSLPDNNFTRSYSSINDNVKLEENNIITAYPNDTTYVMSNPTVAVYNNGIIEKLNMGYTDFKRSYKISDTCTYTINDGVSFVGLNSSYYIIDNEAKTIDVKETLLNNVYTSRITAVPYIFSKIRFDLNINGDKLEIKNSKGVLIGTYKFINYKLFSLSSSIYIINEENKTIDTKGKIYSLDAVRIDPSNFYSLRRNDDKIEVIDKEKNVVDTYEIINERLKNSEAYKKAGFKDKNLYAWVVASVVGINSYEEVSMYKDFLLTEEEMQGITDLGVFNQDITDTTGMEKLTNLDAMALINTNIESIDLSKYPELNVLIIRNGKLTSLDVSNNPHLQHIDVSYNNISKIKGLEKLEELGYLFAYNNNLSSIDVSKITNMEVLMIDNNPITNTIYMLKGKEIDYKNGFKLNESYELKYDITDTNVISYKESKLKALKEDISAIYISNENIYNYKIDVWDKQMACEYFMDQKACEALENIDEEEMVLPYIISQEVKVYDILSDTYKIDKDKKTIDASGLDLDTGKIKVTLEGLSTKVSGDNLIIKDGETIVETYKILNMKKVVEKPSSDNNDNKTTTTKKLGSNNTNKETNNKKNPTTKIQTGDLSDIELKGDFVSALALGQIKGKDRNIVIKNDGITITINGKDIEEIKGNLDLSYEMKSLKESFIYEEVKDKVVDGIVLSFKGNKLPGKVLVELEVTEYIKKNIGIKDIKLYKYDSKDIMLVADKINKDNNKLSFYVNRLGNYVLTSNKINDKQVEIDKSMYEENETLSNNINNKKLIIPLTIYIVVVILGVVGYVIYRKNKKNT